jgi:cytochrome c oxidase subunit II
MALAIVVVLLLITAASGYLMISHPFLTQPGWFPAGASLAAGSVDHQFAQAMNLLGALFVAAQVLLAIFVLLSWRRRREGAKFHRGNTKLEILWTVAIAILFFGFNAAGARAWMQMEMHHAKPGTMKIEVTGAQFQWYFRYAGADGQFGRIDAQRFAKPEEGNALGLDPDDPAGRDDIVSTVLMLPVDQDVELELRAQDVIHSLFIPAMRFKHDTVPGMTIPASLHATQAGTYEIACAELCGTGHYRMHAVVKVVSSQEFAAWLQSQGKR